VGSLSDLVYGVLVSNGRVGLYGDGLGGFGFNHGEFIGLFAGGVNAENMAGS
jgi:hypothetical protein